MDNPSSIRLLGTTNNERGDLFTRLVRDLFFSLGYDNLELDVATSGRELDIQGEHRFEPRRLAAECKAHAASMGGGELNKFLGVLTRERRKHHPKPVAGYFVSLGGFTGTSVEQEKESGDDAIIQFDAESIIVELQRSRVVVPLAEATERAGRCAETHGLGNVQLGKVELIGHSNGYLWAIHFTRNKKITHLSLVHADGTPLAEAVADIVIEADREAGGSFHTLTYLAPVFVPDAQEMKTTTLRQYRDWLGEECGYIQLDGLPADSDLSATKLKLEKLFVPLKASHRQIVKRSALAQEIDLSGIEAEVVAAEAPTDQPTDEPLGEVDMDRGSFDPADAPDLVTEPIGRLLERVNHLAILASPGGGKSTLVKRLATSYAFPERRLEVADELPERDWLPLYLRCRDLRDRANRPVLELLHGIAAFANMNEEQAKCFRTSVSDALRSGRALLLVDGLDEISDEGSRRTFAQTLRTFVAMFPNVALVVTSRVAGFRDVAGVIAGTCQQVTLAPLDEADVRQLCVSWHVEVVADSDKVRTEAAELAAYIWNNGHIRKLVENPLLLTTLLVVKRSNGEIPPTRAELYSEAVRVLVRTWNVEGYAPLDERETLARLSYVACAMMQRGIQLVGNTALVKLLHEAASEMEPELQFARVSPSEFIQRIEYRSSLLMQTGYQRLDGELQPVFEFRHLTFQEYLAARGFVSEQYPGRNEEQPLVEVLAPHIGDERWQEVIPLAAVMAGRKADPVIKRLTAVSAAVRTEQSGDVEDQPSRAISALGRCLMEEVTLTPTTLRAALLEVGHQLGLRRPTMVVEAILKGKFGGTFREVIEEAYFSVGMDWTYFDAALSEAVRIDTGKARADFFDLQMAEGLSRILSEGSREERTRAALLAMEMAFECRDDPIKAGQILGPHSQAFRQGFSEMVLSEDLPSAQAAAWALAWFGNAEVWSDPTPLETIRQLFKYWREGAASELVRKSAWAISSQPLFQRDAIPLETWGACDSWLQSQLQNEGHSEKKRAAIIVAWYRHSPWTDTELAKMIEMHFSRRNFPTNAREMLSELGSAGTNVLTKWYKPSRASKT
jgi:hypothetical protein